MRISLGSAALASRWPANSVSAVPPKARRDRCAGNVTSQVIAATKVKNRPERKRTRSAIGCRHVNTGSHRPSADSPRRKLKSYRRASGVLSSFPRKACPRESLGGNPAFADHAAPPWVSACGDAIRFRLSACRPQNPKAREGSSCGLWASWRSRGSQARTQGAHFQTKDVGRGLDYRHFRGHDEETAHAAGFCEKSEATRQSPSLCMTGGGLLRCARNDSGTAAATCRSCFHKGARVAG
jgi:hypothetical protein